MAYRFNPPPNWPVDEPGWTPPPGWQPDPSWGPAPEGWNFWVAEDQPAAASEVGPVAEPADEDDDATRISRSSEREVLSEDAGAPADRAEPQGLGADSTGLGADSDHRGADSDGLGATSDATSDRVGADLEDDDATRVSSSRERDALAQDSAAASGYCATDASSVSEASGGQDHAAVSADAPAEPSSDAAQPGMDEAPRDGAATTSEYQASDLTTDAPYENAQPSGSTDPAGSGAAVGAAAAGAAAYGAGQNAAGGYGQDASAGYGQDAGDAGQSSPQGYGQPSPNGYGQPSADSYGQTSPSGYGQTSPNGYGQASPNGYGQASSAGDSYGANGTSQQWSSVQGGNEPPKKSFLARFWWLGCIALFLIVALIAGIILAASAFMGKKEDTTGGDKTTTASSSESATDSESPTDSESATEEPTIPANLPTVDPSAQPVEVASSQGKGTMQVSMAWVSADQIPADYGEIDPPKNADQYLVVTAHIKVDEGTLSMNPYSFAIVTPYGGEIDAATVTYQMKDNGISNSSKTEINGGEEYSVAIVYDIAKNPGLKLRYDTFDNQYDWDVPV